MLFLKRPLVWSFLIFVAINIALYSYITFFYAKIPFNMFNYRYNAYHYTEDTRIQHKAFSLLDGLAQFDGQFYLKIATKGYIWPQKAITSIYAFFPLYPLILFLLNFLIKNIELSAFICSNILLILNFFSLYVVIKQWSSEKHALKTIFLLFLFPFSIFYRSYYTEGLYLFLLIWFSYFSLKNKYIYAALFLGLMNVTRGNGLLLNILFFYLLYKAYRKKILSIKRIFFASTFLCIPFIVWLIFNFHQTGNLFYFSVAQKNWFDSPNILLTFMHNIYLALSFFYLPFHSFHYSKVDIFIAILSIAILIKSAVFLPRRLWAITAIILLTPLFVKDTMSFSRFVIVLFPLFLFVSNSLKNVYYYLVLCLCCIGLFIVSLYFVNWYWIG